MMKKFLDEETHMLKEMVDKVVAIGANVLICQKGLDDIAQHYLAKAGILAVRRVKESDMTNLAKATGARIANNFEDLSSKDLGYAALVEERKVEQDKWVFIEGTKNPKAVTILVRGGTQRIVDEADRSLHDALMVTKDVIEKPAIVAGGGAPEAEMATRILKWTDTLIGQGAACCPEVRGGARDDPDRARDQRRPRPDRHDGGDQGEARRGREVVRHRS